MATVAKKKRRKEQFSSFEEVRAAFPHLRWKQHRIGNGMVAYARIREEGAETGTLALTVIENTAAPRHEHLGDHPIGEMIFTLAGALEDIDDQGRLVTLQCGDVLVHRGGSIHMPSATFWFGMFFQPVGSRRV